MPKYMVSVEPIVVLSMREYIIEADNELIAKDFAAEMYMQEAGGRLELDLMLKDLMGIADENLHSVSSRVRCRGRFDPGKEI